jgi:microcystin-dependent protein
MATTIQNLHSLTAGNKPGDLLAGQIAYNVADGFVYLGNGSNVYTDTLGNTIGPSTNPGGGWQQSIFNAAPVPGAVTLAGTYDAQANLVSSVTAAGTTAGFVAGDPLPAAAVGNADYYVLVQIGGTLTPPAPTGDANPGDWLVSTGNGWSLVDYSNTTIPASNVTLTPGGDITATDVQTALTVQLPLIYTTQADGVVSQLNCNGDANVYGSTTLGDTSGDTLTVNATSTFASPVAVNANATVSGTLQVTDALSSATSIYSAGGLRADGNVDFRGNMSFGNSAADTVTITGPITAQNNLTVTGVSQLNGVSQINGSLTTTGAISITGSAGVILASNTQVSSGADININANSQVIFNTGSTLTVASGANTSTLSSSINLNGAAFGKTITYTRPRLASSPSGSAQIAEPLPNFLVIPGTIITFAQEGYTPDGYIWCNGAPYSRTQYADLFAAIGTRWGAGDGSTTFNVPDLRGVFLRGSSISGVVNMENGARANGGSTGTYSTGSFYTHNHTITTNTGDLAGTSFKNNRLFWALPTFQQTGASSGSGAGDVEVKFPSDQNRTPVGNTGGIETKPVSATVTYFIKY